VNALETQHRIALARELTAAAGCPLRDRYGFAARDEDVLFVVEAVFRHPVDADASRAIGTANALGEIELAEEYDVPLSEESELRIIAALRPLTENRRDAASRSLS
jgi:hypothetical protein